jgi:hypothetical protein
MKKEWLVLVNRVDDLPIGKEVSLFVKDLTPGPQKYDTHHVKAVISQTPDESEEGGILRFRSALGMPLAEIRGIRILAEKEPYVWAKPYSDSIGFIRIER